MVVVVTWGVILVASTLFWWCCGHLVYANIKVPLDL